MSSRESESTQTLCPISHNFFRRSFTATTSSFASLVMWLLQWIAQEPVQDDGSRPRLAVGAEGFSGKRLEVLSEAIATYLIQSRSPNPFGPPGLTGLQQRAPQQPVNHRPCRTPPVTARVKPRLFGTGARWQWPAQFGVTCEGGRV